MRELFRYPRLLELYGQTPCFQIASIIPSTTSFDDVKIGRGVPSDLLYMYMEELTTPSLQRTCSFNYKICTFVHFLL